MIKLRNTNIFFSDFETLTFNSKTFQERLKNGEDGLTDVWLWCLLKSEDDYVIGNTLSEYFDTLFEKAKNINGSILVYFHNLSFDGNFIMKYLMKNYPTWFIQEQDINPEKYKPYFKIFTDSNKIYSIEINYVWRIKNNSGNWKWREKRIIFKCSYLILSSSIEKLGDSLGIPKLKDIDYLIENNIIKDKNEFYDLGDFDLKETNKIVYDTYIKYIYTDTKIAYLAVKKFDETLLGEDNEDIYFYKKSKKNIKKMDVNVSLKNKLTIASIAFKLMVNNVYLNCFKDNFKDKEIIKHLFIYDEEEYNNAKLSYRGGFTQFNISKQLKETNTYGMSIDITSSYPYQMTKLIPYDNKRYYRNELSKEFEYLKYYDINIEFSIKEEYKDKIYCIPRTKQINEFITEEQVEALEIMLMVLDKNNYRYPKSGSGRYIVFAEELKIWETLYDIKYNSKQEFYLKADYYLKPFIDKYYNLKEEADRNKQDALKQCYKILLNSCYGATAKRKIYNELYASDKVFSLNEKVSFGKKNKQGKVRSYDVKVVKEKKWLLGDKILNLYDLREDRKINKFPNAMIASQITSYGRIQLLKTILSIGIDNFLYCDTDSIYFNWDWTNEKEMEKLKKIVNINEFELGGWKIEKIFDNMIVRGAKDYSVWRNGKNIGITMSGIKKDKQKEIATRWEKKLFLEEVIEIEDATLQRQECSNGIYLVWISKLKNRGNH